MTEQLKVDDGQVVSMDYTLHVDGQKVDTSEGHSPLQFIQGQGHIIPALAHALYGMAVGESKNVIVAAKDGYGEVDQEAFMDVPRAHFPNEIPLKRDTELELRDQAGHPVYARVDEVGEENVRLDLNHPLAGRELHFDVTIAAIRRATQEEIAHGHVHEQEQGH